MSAKLAFVFSIYLLSTLSVRPMTPAQQPSASLKASAIERTKEGDQPDNPGPIATDLSSKLTSPAIRAAMKKVGDWQLRVGEANFNNDWTFAALYDGMQTPGPFSPDAASAGRRALRNAALTYLAQLDDTPARAKAAYDAANNMTDLSAALTILAHRFPDAAETAAALEHFRVRFSENALVIDKWFAIQAGIPGAGALERIQRLMETPLFKRTNPNRMRALLGTFVFANPTGFGRADGAGYGFLADEILDIDERNPQLAARILTSMRSWRLLEPVRADHARSALMRIERAGGLSSDVRDIVERILKE